MRQKVFSSAVFLLISCVFWSEVSAATMNRMFLGGGYVLFMLQRRLGLGGGKRHMNRILRVSRAVGEGKLVTFLSPWEIKD